MVMRGALIHIGIGLAIGIAAALLSVRFVESQLYEIKGIDAGVLLTAIFTLMAAACIAGMNSRAPRRLHRSRPRATNGVTPGDPGPSATYWRLSPSTSGVLFQGSLATPRTACETGARPEQAGAPREVSGMERPGRPCALVFGIWVETE
jgi:hypothetical protein